MEKMNETDQQIINLLKAKDFDGLEQLIDIYGSTIVRNIRSVLNNPVEFSYIEEVQNDVFYRIWDKIDLFDPEKSSFKTWLIHIARNLSIDKKRQVIKDLRMTPSEELDLDAVEEKYFEEEDFHDLLKSLSADDQLIFLKYYFYKDKPEEIARDLGMSPDMIYNHLSRGRKKLRSILAQNAEGGN